MCKHGTKCRALPPAGFLFTLDIVLLFHTGFIITCNLRKRLIMDGYFVARYYAKHASLLVDVLATVPAWIEVNIPDCQCMVICYARLHAQAAFISLHVGYHQHMHAG